MARIKTSPFPKRSESVFLLASRENSPDKVEQKWNLTRQSLPGDHTEAENAGLNSSVVRASIEGIRRRSEYSQDRIIM